MASRKIIALIPYYAGTSPECTNSPERDSYLVRTVRNASSFADTVCVGVGRLEDAYDAKAAGARVIAVNYEDPWHIPSLTSIRAQEIGITDDYTHVYVTEADQLLNYDPEVLNIVQGNDYLVPHRVEKISKSGGGANSGPNVTVNGEQYVIGSGAQWWDNYREGIPGEFYEATLKYGGGFLCTSELFKRTVFPLLPSGESPIETATGYAVANSGGHCLRTTEWRRFWAEHLSAERYWAQKAGDL